MPAPVIPLIVIGTGGYLAWFGIHYFKRGGWPTAPIKSVLQGKGLPAPGAVTLSADQQAVQASASEIAAGTPVQVTAAGQANIPGSTGSAIANDALKYVGAGYVYGGNADQVGNWDCSSFVSYVLGHDLGIPLPGGAWGDPGFPPSSHGPTTVTYLMFGTAVNNASVVAGDLVVYETHMGIATDRDNMVSARDPAQGTGVDSIAGMTGALGEIPFFRRVT